MKLYNKLERKFSKYAIPNLMKYIVILYAVGLIIGTFNSELVFKLSLDFNKVAKGQVWRLVTFIIPISTMNDLLYTFLKAFVFYSIGNSLERAWGSYRLNFYFFSGVFYNIIAALIVFLLTGINILSVSVFILQPMDLIYSSLFFAFAALYPDIQFMVYFLIPVKAKYLAVISGLYYVYMIYQMIHIGAYLLIVPIVASLANFIIFFFATRNTKRFSPREFQRRAKFKSQMSQGSSNSKVVDMNGKPVVARHKCSICGRTELDDDNLEFRFCSKCEGNYEYCSDHLYTHEHVTHS